MLIRCLTHVYLLSITTGFCPSLTLQSNVNWLSYLSHQTHHSPGPHCQYSIQKVAFPQTFFRVSIQCFLTLTYKQSVLQNLSDPWECKNVFIFPSTADKYQPTRGTSLSIQFLLDWPQPKHEMSEFCGKLDKYRSMYYLHNGTLTWYVLPLPEFGVWS